MLQIGQEYQVGRFLVKPFKTYHTVPSQVRTAPPVIHCVCVYCVASCCVDAPICRVGKQSQHNVMSFACTSHHAQHSINSTACIAHHVQLIMQDISIIRPLAAV